MTICEYKHCNNEFLYRSNKKFCSFNCKVKAKNARLESRKLKIKESSNRRKRPYIIFKKDYCEHCNFIPLHTCQLDVDHIDGNNKNNNPENLQTLCANCHRLKTFLNKDWENKNNQ